MDKFVWTEEYSVGIKEIDEQHQHFFEIANKVLDIFLQNLTEEQGPTREEIMKLLTDLADYGFYHFSIEEKYFDKFNYPEAGLHINSHNTYREVVAKYFNDARKEETDIKKLAGEMAQYSSNWLSHHILLMDKKYTKFFQEHGLN